MSINETLVSYLPKRITISNEVFSLNPLSDFDETIEEVMSTFHIENDFCFPKSVKIKYRNEVENGNLVEKEVSRSPSFQPEIFKFYPTHTFHLNSKNDSALNKFDQNPSFFILQIIAYITGFRVVPHDFWFDGKIPIKPTNNVLCTDLSPIVDKAFKTWESLEPNARNELSAIFYFYNRSPSYHWRFEKFSHDFMIFDSALKFYKSNISDFQVCKGKKYYNFLDHLNISYKEDILKILIDSRNDLFHQFKWGEGAPGLFADGQLIGSAITFRRMLHAVLGKLINLEGKYFNNDWESRGTMSFDVQ